MNTTKRYLYAFFIVLEFAFLYLNKSVGQVPQADFKSVVWYDIWSYDQYPPHRMQYNGIKQLVIFGGATSGITPSTTSPYFPARDYNSFAYRSTFHGDGWANMSKYFPGTTKTWMQLIRDSCNAHGIDLYLDLGGEYGSPATAFNALIADRTKWTAYINAVSEVCQNNPDGVRFDGVSFDIEWLGSTAQNRQDFTDFVTAMKAKLNTWAKPGKIGAATAMWFLWQNNPSTPYITPSTVNAYFDWLFIMGYNTFNSSRLGFEAQLYQHPNIPGVEVWNDRATTQYTGNGINPKIIVLGTSGEVLKQTINGAAVPGGPASGSTTGSGSGARVNQIFNTAILDPITKASYAIDGNIWYSFETVASTNEKIKITQSFGLGGIGYYSTFASNDGGGGSSVNKSLNAYQNAVAAVIGGYVPPIEPTVTISANVLTIKQGQSIALTVSTSVGTPDSIVLFKLPSGSSVIAIRLGASVGQTSWSTSVQGTVVENFGLFARRYNGASVFQSGTLPITVTDSTVVIPPPPVVFSASISVTSPSWTLGDSVAIVLKVNAAVTNFDIYDNGTKVLNGLRPEINVPLTVKYKPTALGQHTLNGYVKPSVGNWVTLANVSYTLNAAPPPPVDATPPSVSITSPLNGETLIAGMQQVFATASDNVGVTKVEFYVDGILSSTDLTSPYSFSWNTTNITGAKVLTARAYDAVGNSAPTTSVQVLIQAPPPPTICLTAAQLQAKTDSAYLAGKSSVVCPPQIVCPDSAGIFRAGMLKYMQSVPDSFNVKTPKPPIQ